MKGCKIYFLFGFVVFTFLLSECTKFEDGRNCSFRTVKGRLIKGSPWIFEKLEVDGVDKSAEFRNDSTYFDKILFIQNNSRVNDEYSFVLDGVYFLFQGHYKLSDKKNFISIAGTGYGDSNGNEIYYSYGPIFLHYYNEWEITRLTMKELQMKTKYAGEEYKLFLKSKKE